MGALFTTFILLKIVTQMLMLRNIFMRSSKESDIQNFYQKLKEVQEVSVSDNREALVCTSLRHIFKLEYQRNYYPATVCPKIKLVLEGNCYSCLHDVYLIV